jgi:hypothetical protein
MKKPSRIMLQNEAIVQSLFMVPLLLLYLLSVREIAYLYIAFIIQFFFAIFQFVSALIRIYLYKSIIRKGYLYAVLAFFLSALIIGNLMDLGSTPSFDYFFWISGMMVIPLLFLLFYFLLTILQGMGKFYHVDLPKDFGTNDNIIDEIMIG